MSARRLKMRSAELLRARLVEWLAARGAQELSKPEHNYIHGGTIGGDWRISTRAGWLLVHLPADAPCIHPNHELSILKGRRIGLLSVNTRFEDWPPRSLPKDANQHSGKWNFSCYESEDRLFIDFTVMVGELLP